MSNSATLAPFPQILVIGDSIVRRSSAPGGYVARLGEEYAGKFDVLNRGFGGYNSRQLVKKVTRDNLYLEEQNGGTAVKLLVLHIGTNDAATDGLHSIPLSEYRVNLQTLIQHFKHAHPTASIIIISPSTCDNSLWTTGDRTPGHSKVYAEACLEEATLANVLSVDAWTLITKALRRGDRPEDIFTDGLHLGAKGYMYISDCILALIKNKLPHLNPETLPFSFEEWDVYETNAL